MIVERRRHLRGESGLATALVSAGAFGASGSFATSLLRSGWTAGAAVAARLVIAALALTIPAVRQLRAHPGALRAGWPTLVLFGLVPVAMCQLCYFEAVQNLSVAVALLLEYSGALLVVGWMWARHRQVPTRMTGAGAAAATVGLVLVLNLIGHHHLAPVGLLWGVGSAVGLAFYFVISARTVSTRTGDEELPPLVVAWGGLLVGAVAMLLVGGAGLLPLRAPRATVVLAHARVSWVVPLLGVGLLAGAFAYVTGIAAARDLGARVASFVGLAEVLFATFYAWLLLGQRLTAAQLVGGALVVAGITLVRAGEPAGPAEAPEAATAGPPLEALSTA